MWLLPFTELVFLTSNPGNQLDELLMLVLQ